ncbi:Platinum sensitivity protein [Savitreella phatthalungensis]
MELVSTSQPRRVKVYEMRGEAWSDRGTGFCMGLVRPASASSDAESGGQIAVAGSGSDDESVILQEATLLVKSEENRDVTLLESSIIKDDLYQVQQNTLIVWQELDGTDVALSFQEEEGCYEIWNFLRHAQKLMNNERWDDGASDSDGGVGAGLDGSGELCLPEPAIDKLAEIEEIVQSALGSVARREALAKVVLHEGYLGKLVGLHSQAEALKSIADLHRLCNVLKSLVLLNDAAIFDCILMDEHFMGVVGIFEYDPEFPRHRADHRRILRDKADFKQVVQVHDQDIVRKIHQTFRLQYLKDVILARLLDDPTFSILNTLIFFNQVDIVQHFQHDETFLPELFELFAEDSTASESSRRDAVVFVQQACGVAKTLQPPARQSLYATLIQHGLFAMLSWALTTERSRLAGADVLVCTIEHDPRLARQHILQQDSRSETTLLELLIDMLLNERDLGVKSQMTEALRCVVDPLAGQQTRLDEPEAERFLELFYTKNMTRLMRGLEEDGVDAADADTLAHLLDLLAFFLRAHTFRCKFFVLSHNVSMMVARLMQRRREKHIKLAALRYFRVCLAINDEYYDRNIVKNHLLKPLVELLCDSDGKDNLLASAVLELFDLIRREKLGRVANALVETHRDQLLSVVHSDVPRNIVVAHDAAAAAAAINASTAVTTPTTTAGVLPGTGTGAVTTIHSPSTNTGVASPRTPTMESVLGGRSPSSTSHAGAAAAAAAAAAAGAFASGVRLASPPSDEEKELDENNGDHAKALGKKRKSTEALGGTGGERPAAKRTAPVSASTNDADVLLGTELKAKRRGSSSSNANASPTSSAPADENAPPVSFTTSVDGVVAGTAPRDERERRTSKPSRRTSR